jgi:hypothetical protein
MTRDDRKLVVVGLASLGAIAGILWWGAKRAQAAQGPAPSAPSPSAPAAQPFPLPFNPFQPPAPGAPAPSMPGIFIPPQVAPQFNPGVFD